MKFKNKKINDFLQIFTEFTSNEIQTQFQKNLLRNVSKSLYLLITYYEEVTQ